MSLDLTPDLANSPLASGLNFGLHSSIIEVEKFMTHKTEKDLRQLIEHAPAGSAIAEAKKFGVDLYTILENLSSLRLNAFAARRRKPILFDVCERITGRATRERH